jgi:hypothetical protein
MGPSVYIETSIVSYLAARPSRDIVVAAHQQITAEWWGTRRSQFTLYASELVAREAGAGNPDAASRRLEFLEGVLLLAATEEARALARHFLAGAVFPPESDPDASHVAIATVHGMEYLLTWNLQHIANAQVRTRIESACRAMGYEPPVLCTPEELMGG